MPFPEQAPWPYSEEGIQRLNAGQRGVYGIFHQIQLGSPSTQPWIYIGKADDLRSRLLEHVRGQSDQAACIEDWTPTHFVAVVSREIIHLEISLIEECGPTRCNKT